MTEQELRELIDSKINEVNEKKSVTEGLTVKQALRNASDALTETPQGKKLDKDYVKDYLKSLEGMAKRDPKSFVKDYGDMTILDYIEDVEYNMANESVVTEERTQNRLKLIFGDLKESESLITEAKGKLKDLAKDLVELDKEGMTWIYRIRVDQEYLKAAKGNVVVAKVTGRAGDSTPKSYVNKLLKKLGFKPKFITMNNLGDFHEYIWHLPEFETSDQYKIWDKDPAPLNYDRDPNTVY